MVASMSDWLNKILKWFIAARRLYRAGWKAVVHVYVRALLRWWAFLQYNKLGFENAVSIVRNLRANKLVLESEPSGCNAKPIIKPWGCHSWIKAVMVAKLGHCLQSFVKVEQNGLWIVRQQYQCVSCKIKTKVITWWNHRQTRHVLFRQKDNPYRFPVMHQQLASGAQLECQRVLVQRLVRITNILRNFFFKLTTINLHNPKQWSYPSGLCDGYSKQNIFRSCNTDLLSQR